MARQLRLLSIVSSPHRLHTCLKLAVHPARPARSPNSLFSPELLRLVIIVSLTHRLDGRQYAVKKIKLQTDGSSSSYNRILREVATLSRLQHPNVVRYFQVGKTYVLPIKRASVLP
jgi:serine/threonine protein kinase